jgi:hypothetical protein
LKIDENKEATAIQRLLDTTSSIEWQEKAYTPDETIMRIYRRPDGTEFVLSQPISGTPGTTFLLQQRHDISNSAKSDPTPSNPTGHCRPTRLPSPCLPHLFGKPLLKNLPLSGCTPALARAVSGKFIGSVTTSCRENGPSHPTVFGADGTESASFLRDQPG